MKKNLFYLFALICSMSLFTACSNDDDPDYTQVIENEIAGEYKGALDISLDGIPVAKDLPKNVTIAKVNGNTISLELKDFNFSGLNLGTIKLEKCVLTESNGTYIFTGNQKLDLTASSIGVCDVTVTGTTLQNETTVNLDIAVPTLGQTVKVLYKGSKLKGNESGEAKITSFIFDRNVAEVDSLVLSTKIDEVAKTISIVVVDTAKNEYLTALVPTIEVSNGATLVPGSKVAQDFSNGNQVSYTVVAEDGTVATYVASVSSKLFVADFEEWIAGVEGQKPEMTFYEPTGWSSSNTGAHFLKAFGLAESYVVMSTEDAHSGEKAALIQSIDTKGQDLWLAKAPKVTTGTLFLGKFITDASSTLNSTKFGVPYSNKPVALKGWYKYTPGEIYYLVTKEPYDQNCYKEFVVDENKTDEFAISVVLYETEQYDLEGWTDCLTGVANAENNIYTSSRIAAIAQLTGGIQADWKNFELPLEWKKEFDANKKYRMTIACSSSKDGDKFGGAPGSTLIVDEFELVVE